MNDKLQKWSEDMMDAVNEDDAVFDLLENFKHEYCNTHGLNPDDFDLAVVVGVRESD